MPAAQPLRAAVAAAMEPAPEERDDSPLQSVTDAALVLPQWSPLRRSGTTEQVDAPHGVVEGAAMEPAPEERDDTAAALLRVSQPPPQWSPLRRSGTTRRPPRARWPAPGRRNGARSGGAGRRCRPPRPRSGRSCRNGARSGGAGRLADTWTWTAKPLAAAMEPAPEERDDPLPRRLHGPVRSVAAMEPAPEERDDCQPIAELVMEALPQWSPLRRSGTTRAYPSRGGR